MALGERVDYSIGLLVVSSLLFLVPLYDMWEDVFVGGKSPLSTILENSIFVFLTVLLIGMSVWLLRADWEEQYVQLVARWAMFGTGVVAAVYAWVIGFQLYFQNDLKPVIIAADGVVIGGIVLFVAGVYNARSRRESAARAVERDRFSALFDNTSDAVAAVESGGGVVRITGVNEPFERTFDRESAELAGKPAVETLSAWAPEESTGDAGPDTAPATRLRRVLDGDDEQVELRLKTGAGSGDFLVGYVSVGNGRSPAGTGGFLVFTDITQQKERERQFETVSEGSDDLLDARSVEAVLEAVQQLTVDMLDDAVTGVWEYDPEGNVYRPRLVGVSGTRSVRVEDLPTLAASGVDAARVADGARSVPAFDTEALRETLARRGYPVEETLTRWLTDSHRLVVGRMWGSLSSTDRYLVDLLVANSRTALQRVEREETLARRNDQLEFVNSLLRHDIQNSMTIIKARARALSESLEGQDADYAATIVNQSEDVSGLVDRFRVLLDALTGSDASFERASLTSVLEERVERFRTTYPSASISADIPDGLTVRADGMIGNVVGNVLGNAVEHNDTDEPTVEVTAAERERVVEVRIADDGPGVPDEKKEVIFRRGNQGLKEANIGSGFGLFFVDTLMERYGGDVTVEDNEPRGSVFVLTFPTE